MKLSRVIIAAILTPIALNFNEIWLEILVDVTYTW